MFKDFLHRISVSVKEETGRIKAVMHEQFDPGALEPQNNHSHHK